MASRTQRNNRWFALTFVLLVVVGIAAIGFWQTFDIQCANGREWSMRVFPPQFVCRF